MRTATVVDNLGAKVTFTGDLGRDEARAHVAGVVSGYGCTYDASNWRYVGPGYEFYLTQEPPMHPDRIGRLVSFFMVCGADE